MASAILRKTLKTCLGAVGVAAACCGTATAATRAQWSFNGTVGTTFVEGNTIPDVSAAGTHPLSIGCFSMDNWEIQWRTPSIVPFMEAPNNACRDTVQGEMRLNESAYGFNQERTDNDSDRFGQGWGSVLRARETVGDLLTLQTFTIEFFWNVDRDGYNHWTCPFSRILSHDSATAGPSAFTLYIQNGGGGIGRFYLLYSAVADAEGTPEIVAGDAPFKDGKGTVVQASRDGKWHHYAVVMDGATHVATLFCDHVAVGTVTLPGPINYGEEPEKHGWAFGGHDVFGWSATGMMDEIRISDVALRPDQFIHYDFSHPDGETLVYMPLDSDFRSIVHTNWNPSGTAAYETETAQKLANGNPSFTSARVKDRMEDGTGALVRRDNAGSVELVDTEVKVSAADNFFWSYLYPKLTIELFVKVDVPGPGGWAQLFQIDNNTGGNGCFPVCIQQGGAGKGLSVRADTYNWETGARKSNSISVPSSAVVYDGKWHHLAITLDGSAGSQTEVKFYVDYELKSTTTLTGYFRVEQAGYFQFGNTAVTACAGQTAHVDEFRISRGILPPEKFIRQVAERGTMVLVR